jgi:hypothetical protein
MPICDPAPDTPPADPGVRSRRPAWLLVAYLATYLAMRLLEHGGLERDDAEIVYLAQDLRLGYGTQPPLYVWLQWLAFQMVGQNRFSLAGVKVAALAMLYVAVAGAGRPLIGRRAAIVAAAALLLFPQFAWEALRIQTHSVLAAALAALALWSYMGLLEQPDRLRYAGFGLACGLGLLAKYNVGIVLAGIVGAGALVPEHRRRVWRPDAWIVLVVAILVTLPHWIWVAQHTDAAFAATLHKMQDGTGDLSYGSRVLGGMTGLLSALASFVALPCIVFAAVAWRRHVRLLVDRHTPAGRFMAGLYAICLLLLVAVVLTGRVGLVKERWLMPILFALPLAALIWLPELRRVEACRTIVRVAAVAAVSVLALLAGRSWLGPLWGRVVAAHHPYALLADALVRDGPMATVVTDDVMLAGNLHFARPGLHTLLADDVSRMPHLPPGPVLLVTQYGNMGALTDAVRAVRAVRPVARPMDESRLTLPLQSGAAGDMTFTVRRVEAIETGPTAAHAPQKNAPGDRPR